MFRCRPPTMVEAGHSAAHRRSAEHRVGDLLPLVLRVGLEHLRHHARRNSSRIERQRHSDGYRERRAVRREGECRTERLPIPAGSGVALTTMSAIAIGVLTASAPTGIQFRPVRPVEQYGPAGPIPLVGGGGAGVFAEPLPLSPPPPPATARAEKQRAADDDISNNYPRNTHFRLHKALLARCAGWWRVVKDFSVNGLTERRGATLVLVKCG